MAASTFINYTYAIPLSLSKKIPHELARHEGFPVFLIRFFH